MYYGCIQVCLKNQKIYTKCMELLMQITKSSVMAVLGCNGLRCVINIILSADYIYVHTCTYVGMYPHMYSRQFGALWFWSVIKTIMTDSRQAKRQLQAQKHLIVHTYLGCIQVCLKNKKIYTRWMASFQANGFLTLSTDDLLNTKVLFLVSRRQRGPCR